MESSDLCYYSLSSGARKWCLISGLPQVNDHFYNVFFLPLILDRSHAKIEANRILNNDLLQRLPSRGKTTC